MKKLIYIADILITLAAGVILILLVKNGNDDKSQSTLTKADKATLKEKESTTEEIKDEGSNKKIKKIRSVSSVELVKEMKIGWNLGNTLDATNPSIINGNPEDYETAWGNPVTTKAMIDTLKESGFNVLRIPITWDGHIGEAPDYTINSAWINRVQEVVDYAIDNDMFVIVNLHHERWHFPSKDNFEKAKNELIKVWQQIGNHFESYDEHLIFESMNEPRMFDTEYEWTGGNKEARDVINKLNEAFIETIRNLKGNNPLRHLMIPSYAASWDSKVLDDFIVPKDDKVIVSIHAYTPYNFALNENGTSTFSSTNPEDVKEIDNLVDTIKSRYISKGIPVIIGEFGARNKDNLKDRVDWAEYYIKAISAKRIPCVWWDNGAFIGDGENFGLLDRNTLTWKYPEIVEALMKPLNTK